MSRSILVSGASIAGNALALTLGRLGFEVTVVERAPAFREGGQNVDVRGVGRTVLRRLGLEQAALARGTREEGTAWIDAGGRVAAQFTVDGSGDGPTAEMEILRGDLARLLHEPARDHAGFLFGDEIRSVEEEGEAVSVLLASGRKQRFDALIVAEGVGSATRDLLFPGENSPRWLDVMLAYWTIPRVSTDDRLWRWYHATGGRSVSLRPDSQGTTRAMLGIRKPPEGEHTWGGERQKAFLHDRFRDAGWEAPRVLAGLASADDFYFDVLRQVRMPRWSKGRVALTGDAAWCVTPLGGIGATLAVTGGYVLAQELARCTTIPGSLRGLRARHEADGRAGAGHPEARAGADEPGDTDGHHGAARGPEGRQLAAAGGPRGQAPGAAAQRARPDALLRRSHRLGRRREREAAPSFVAEAAGCPCRPPPCAHAAAKCSSTGGHRVPMGRKSAVLPDGIRGRGIATAGHGGGSSSSSLRRERTYRCRFAGRRGRLRGGSFFIGGAASRSSSASVASTASTDTGSALEPVRQRRPGAFSRAQASDAQEARIARLSAPDRCGCARTSRGWRNTSPGATSACHASKAAGCRPGGFVGPTWVRCVSVVDMDHPP
jgi:2-polyprenyl-6-methoxyphenol hydroxylase-like FAD-dependent oxidoreductase